MAERLWLDFVNSDSPGVATDALYDFDRFVRWLESVSLLDAERASGMSRRAIQQPAGALAVLGDARRMRTILRALAERGAASARTRADAAGEINRVLGRSAGTRRVEMNPDGTFARTFVSVGDAFAGLLISIVESAADALILSELTRVRKCADHRCGTCLSRRVKEWRTPLVRHDHLWKSCKGGAPPQGERESADDVTTPPRNHRHSGVMRSET